MQHYNKNNRMKDIRLRFHFDAKAEDNKMRGKSKQRISSMTTKDDNEEFSTVKQENDFNDSSWLAKLVNGIEENCNIDKAPLSEITNITSKNTSSLHTKKTSLNNIYTIERKMSEENIMGQKKCKIIHLKEKSKSKDKDRDEMKSEEKENKKESKKIVKNMKQNLTIINDKKTADYSIKERRKCAFLNKKNAKAHKNSLINYSSIKEEEQSMEKCEKSISENDIVINLNDVSLRTEFSKENTPTPVQIRSRDTEEKYLTNINTPEKIISSKPKVELQTIGTRTRRWSSHLTCKTEEQSNTLISKETYSHMRENSTPVKNLGCHTKIDVNKNNEIIKMEPDISSKDLVSENEFLDIQKNQNQITFSEAPFVKIGSIRKNKISKEIPCEKVEVDKLELFSIKKDDTFCQFKPPTFNERPPHQTETAEKIKEKVDSRISHSLRNSFKDIKTSSVQKEHKSYEGLYCSNLNSVSTSILTSRKCVEIFEKLDGKGEGAIYKDNCNEMALKKEEKYEFGSIISKIKYLDFVFSRENFLIECEKIHKGLFDKQGIDMDNLFTNNKIETKEPHKVPLSADNVKVRKQLFPKNEYLNFQNYDYLPLFPENKDIDYSNESETVCGERDQLGKHMIQKEKAWVSSKGSLASEPEINEIGNKIDSLNSKLTNYIKNNDLEDTYSRFKLEFVELRKNMFH